jgi:hypothetical protein
MRGFLGEIVKHIWRAPEGAAKIGGHYREDQRGINSPYSAHVKIAKRESANPQIAQNVAGDKIAGNDKENVDADEPAFEATDLQMEQDDADDRNGSQPRYLIAKKSLHKLSPSSWIQ